MDKLLYQIYGPQVGQPGHLPYRIFCDGLGETYGLKGVSHWPGSSGQQSEVMPTQEKMWGFVGLLVEDYKKPVSDQQVRLAWHGIDIDGSDNPDMDVTSLVTKTIMLFEHEAVVRTSKSGTGIHLIFPRREPVVGQYGNLKALAKADAIPQLLKLVKNKVAPCVYGLVNMWLYSEGGKQRTLHIPEWLR